MPNPDNQSSNWGLIKIQIWTFAPRGGSNSARLKFFEFLPSLDILENS